MSWGTYFETITMSYTFKISYCYPLHMYVLPFPDSPVIKQPLLSSNSYSFICVSLIGLGHSSIYLDALDVVFMHLLKS
jgi:hypothetical protein